MFEDDGRAGVCKHPWRLHLHGGVNVLSVKVAPAQIIRYQGQKANHGHKAKDGRHDGHINFLGVGQITFLRLTRL